MKLYFIRTEYKTENELPVLYLWGRKLDTKEKLLFMIRDFYPHFYVLESEKIPDSSMIKSVKSGFKSIFGEACKQVTVVLPENVNDLKPYFSKTFEADIPFTRRFLINTGIRRYFTIPDDKQELSYKEIQGE